MKSLQELNAIRERMQKQTLNRDAATENSTRVVVGMATCGIAAGAKPVMSAFLEEVSKRNLKHVVVSQTGCIGMCKLEPIVEVLDRKSTRLNSSHPNPSRMPSSA